MWDLFVRVVCDRERVCEDSRLLKTKGVFGGSLRVSFPRSDACALHTTVIRRVRIGWRQLIFASISGVRPSRKTPEKHSVFPNCHF